jgi:predicted transcriptional regulator
MFNIGDKVVYPMHGAGIIEAIEEKEILGEKQKYYVMRMPIGDMKVMIPLKNIKEIGVRQVAGDDEIREVLNILHGEKSKMSANWNRRYRANMEKIRSGGYIRIKKLKINEDEFLKDIIEYIGDSISGSDSKAILERLWEEDVITEREMKILNAAINKYNLPLCPQDRDMVRARIMKAVITALLDFEARKGGA